MPFSLHQNVRYQLKVGKCRMCYWTPETPQKNEDIKVKALHVSCKKTTKKKRSATMNG